MRSDEEVALLDLYVAVKALQAAIEDARTELDDDMLASGLRTLIDRCEERASRIEKLLREMGGRPIDVEDDRQAAETLVRRVKAALNPETLISYLRDLDAKAGRILDLAMQARSGDIHSRIEEEVDRTADLAGQVRHEVTDRLARASSA